MKYSVVALASFEAFSSYPAFAHAVDAAAAGNAGARGISSPTEEIRRSTETLKGTLMRRPPSWSPEAEVQLRTIRNVIDHLLDFEEIARRTLGDQWERLSGEQQREFTTLLQRLTGHQSLEDGFQFARDTTVAYRPESISRDRATVPTIVTVNSTEREVRRTVDYRLYLRDKRWRVYDIVIDGESLVENYRDEFARIIRQESYDGLVRRMKKRVARLPG
jgi:phospholipid transport system substrate-binding protein